MSSPKRLGCVSTITFGLFCPGNVKFPPTVMMPALLFFLFFFFMMLAFYQWFVRLRLL